MSLDDLKIEIQNLSNPDFESLKQWLLGPATTARAHQSRLAVAASEARIELLEQLNVAPPEAVRDFDPEQQSYSVGDFSNWSNPGSNFSKMYRTGDVVRHNNRIWKNNHPGLNHWEPGGEGVYQNVWEDVTWLVETSESDESETSTTPYSDNQQWQKGQVVEFQGSLYECLGTHFAAPGWTPLNAHAYWRKM